MAIDNLEEPLLPRKHEEPSAAAPRDTFWPCVMNLSKVITGAGMMAIPRAFLLIGWLPGSIMLVGVALLTFFTLTVLVQGSAATQSSTYGELALRTCGRGVMRVLQLAVLLFCFGFSVVYLVVIRDILLGSPPECNGLLCEAFGPAANIDARLLIIAVAVLACAPLLLMRSMDRLAALNTAGVAATVLLSLAAVTLAVVAAAAGQAHPIRMLPQWSLLGHSRTEQLEALTDVIPVILACYVAHQSLHPLMPMLKPYSQARMLKVVGLSLSISAGNFLLLSVGAAVAFGPATDINVLNNFSIEGLQPLLCWQLSVVVSWVVRGGYLLCILATLLLYMHPLRGCLAQMLWPEPDRPHAASATGAVHGHAIAVNTAAVSDTEPGPLCSTSDSTATARAAGGGSHQHHGAVALPGEAPQSLPAASSSSQPHPQHPKLEHEGIAEQQQEQRPAEAGPSSSGPQLWQVLEQATYYPLTYGLLAGMVLVAVLVRNIYQAVSAVGDIASTTQAFIVPGAIAIALVLQARAQIRAAVAATAAALLSHQDDIEASGSTTDADPGADLPCGCGGLMGGVSAGSVLYAVAGATVLLLGLGLFGNGVYERISFVL